MPGAGRRAPGGLAPSGCGPFGIGPVHCGPGGSEAGPCTAGPAARHRGRSRLARRFGAGPVHCWPGGSESGPPSPPARWFGTGAVHRRRGGWGPSPAAAALRIRARPRRSTGAKAPGDLGRGLRRARAARHAAYPRPATRRCGRSLRAVGPGPRGVPRVLRPHGRKPRRTRTGLRGGAVAGLGVARRRVRRAGSGGRHRRMAESTPVVG